MGFGDFASLPRRRVVVTGIGLVTPVGIGVGPSWEALCAGRSAGRALREVPHFLPESYLARYTHASTTVRDDSWPERVLRAMPCQVAAPVCGTASGADFSPTARESRAMRFCDYAVREALRDAKLLTSPDATGRAGVVLQGVQPDRVGVNIGTGMPSLTDITDVAAHLYGDATRVQYNRIHPLFVPKILGNTSAGLTAIRYGLTGPIGSSVAACATGAHCIGEAAAWVKYGEADVAVCGATEACITPIAIAGFARMRALCTRYADQPATASRPFDVDRAGFVMGEGAGVLVLETLEHARARGVRHVYAELRGFGVACDAHDLAAPHPCGRGARKCVEAALRDAGGVPRDAVGYVNAHATGTMGDVVELDALRRVFRGDRVVDTESADTTHVASSSSTPLYVSSSKGSMGHLLGAAGSVEAAVAVLALHHQAAPPTANLTRPCLTASQQNAAGVALVSGTQPVSLGGRCEAVLSTSFGFGGVNTALVFTQV